MPWPRQNWWYGWVPLSHLNTYKIREQRVSNRFFHVAFVSFSPGPLTGVYRSVQNLGLDYLRIVAAWCLETSPMRWSLEMITGNGCDMLWHLLVPGCLQATGKGPRWCRTPAPRHNRERSNLGIMDVFQKMHGSAYVYMRMCMRIYIYICVCVCLGSHGKFGGFTVWRLYMV